MCVHIAAPSSVKAALRALLQAQPEAVPVGLSVYGWHTPGVTLQVQVTSRYSSKRILLVVFTSRA